MSFKNKCRIFVFRNSSESHVCDFVTKQMPALIGQCVSVREIYQLPIDENYVSPFKLHLHTQAQCALRANMII